MSVMRWQSEPVDQLSAGIGRQVVHLETMTVARIVLAAGAVVASHAHENEQVTTVLEGRLRFVVDGSEHVVDAGESVVLPANAQHEVEALSDAVALDVFSPVRQDWLSGDDSYLRK